MRDGGWHLFRMQVLQTLYSCQPFRDRLLQYAAGPATRDAEETILSCLADLFVQVPILIPARSAVKPGTRTPTTRAVLGRVVRFPAHCAVIIVWLWSQRKLGWTSLLDVSQDQVIDRA
jgi:hypothetical protein